MSNINMREADGRAGIFKEKHFSRVLWRPKLFLFAELLKMSTALEGNGEILETSVMNF